jgi:hypothetical protein
MPFWFSCLPPFSWTIAGEADWRSGAFWYLHARENKNLTEFTAADESGSQLPACLKPKAEKDLRWQNTIFLIRANRPGLCPGNVFSE